MTARDSTPIPRETIGLSMEVSPDGIRFCWLGEDGEQAFALGHHVGEEAFARALEIDLDYFGGVERCWVVCRRHSEACLDAEADEVEEADEPCSCDEYGWWASFSPSEVDGSFAVTRWSQ